MASCTQSVTVQDHEKPTITCPANLTDVPTDAGQGYATVVALGGPTTGDNCPGQSAVNDAPTQFPKGTTIVTWTVTDASGNTASCTQSVTVQDHEKPTITCPANLTDVPTDAGQGYATVVALGGPTTGDNCPGQSAVNDAPTQFPKGTTIVTWTVTDASGNTASCTQSVTVQDHEKPTITCPANLTDVPTDAGQCYATGVALGAPITNDNCPGQSAVNDAPTQFPKGTTIVTWTVTDASGNTASCTQSVTVQDHEKPTITCPANLTDVPTDAGQGYATVVALGGPTTGDNCPGQSAVNDAPTQFPKGTTIVTWTVTDASGNTASCTQSVTVQDHEKPTITCPANLTDVPTDAGQCYATGVALGAPITNDNCPGQSAVNDAPTQFPKGTTIVTWTVTDASGNTASCTQSVTVQDHEKPTITCPANLTDVPTDAGQCYATGVALGAPTTGDNCPGQSAVNDAPTQFPKGTSIVTWTVTDASGNTASCTQSVTVQDHEKPTITCPANLTDVPTDAGQCYATGVALGAPTTGDNCPGQSAVNDAPTQFPKGTSIVTWTVTDASGNTASCTQSVTVQDHEKPTITCPASITAAKTSDGGTGDCLATVSVGTATATDNCDATGAMTIVGTRSDTQALSDPYPTGTTTITWKATDTSGNFQTCTQTVTVSDDENPSINGCPNNITVYTGPGRATCDQVATWTAPTATDNCAVSSFTSSKNPGATFPVGATTVTYTAKDAAGNQSQCSFTVTVLDNTLPIITCSANHI